MYQGKGGRHVYTYVSRYRCISYIANKRDFDKPCVILSGYVEIQALSENNVSRNTVFRTDWKCVRRRR